MKLLLLVVLFVPTMGQLLHGLPPSVPEVDGSQVFACNITVLSLSNSTTDLTLSLSKLVDTIGGVEELLKNTTLLMSDFDRVLHRFVDIFHYVSLIFCIFMPAYLFVSLIQLFSYNCNNCKSDEN